MTTLISTCKTAAYELYSYLMSNHWKYFRKWMQNAEKAGGSGGYSESRKAIITLIEKLISVANSDYKKENLQPILASA